MSQTPQASSRLRHFLAGIIDLRFQRNLTMQLLPLFYVLLLLGAAGVLLVVTAIAFWLSPLAGMGMLVLSPLGFLAAAAVIRAALEYLVMAYRIMETVQGMQHISAQVDHLSTEFDQIAAEVHHMRGQVDQVGDAISAIKPLLQPLTLPGRLMRSYQRHKQP
jgi:predicted neutral ceramidase superfamily lipid hydrolase